MSGILIRLPRLQNHEKKICYLSCCVYGILLQQPKISLNACQVIFLLFFGAELESGYEKGRKLPTSFARQIRLCPYQLRIPWSLHRVKTSPQILQHGTVQSIMVLMDMAFTNVQPYLFSLLQGRDLSEATVTKLFVYSLILLFTSARINHLLSASHVPATQTWHSYTGLGLEMVFL